MLDSDLGSMQQAILKSDGTGRLLRWLARRLRGDAVLLDSSGNPAAGTSPPPAVLEDASETVNRVIAGDLDSACITNPAWWARVASASTRRGGPVLLVTSSEPLSPDGAALITHAAVLLKLRRSADDRDRAVTQIREAVLHMLMAGDAVAARRVAGAMKPELADRVRVYLIEGTSAARNALADKCEIACPDAWIVRCPVYRHHVIILVPVTIVVPVTGDADPDEKILPVLRSVTAEAAIGIGETVPLRQTADSWQQAYHAVRLAWHSPDRCARFTAAGDLAAVLGPAAGPWARHALSPLLDYEPPRPQDPDGAELLATLRIWLAFRSNAWKALQVYRTTLTKRLRRIEAILGRPLSSLPVQAELHLALQLLHHPGDSDGGVPPKLGELLADPDAREWATVMLAPLDDDPMLLHTVRAWLANDARADRTAAELRISERGLRGRLERVERLLKRSLTGGPSVRYDVLLALRIRDGTAPGR